jgi:hypothetical protein
MSILEVMPDLREKLDRFTPWPMFLATVAFLVLLGFTLPLLRPEVPATDTLVHCHIALWALYCLFVIEAAVHLVIGSPRWRQHLFFCLVPPLRLVARDAATGKRIWVASIGWQEVNEELEQRVARTFSGPMILIALAMVPLLALEFIWGSMVDSNAAIKMIVECGTAVIWAAFTVEFIVMVAVVKKRLKYCKEHWIDIVIILAPLLAFARLLRLGRLLRLQTLARTTRVYRLRGLAMRAYRAIFLFEVVQKILLSKPEKRLAKLEEQLAERTVEVRSLEKKIARLRAEIAQRDEQEAPTKETATASSPDEPVETVPIVDEGSETVVAKPHVKGFQGEPGSERAAPANRDRGRVRE